MSEKRKGRIGPLEVLKSNAGYYIGRLYYGQDGEVEPYSRESASYYKTKEVAQSHLDNNTYVQKLTP